MAVRREPVIEESIVRSLSDVLGRTEDGLTNKEISELLAAARIPDPTPAPTKYTYVAINKRDRLFRALVTKQHKDGCGNAVLMFLRKALAPVRFHGSPGTFEAFREEVNIPLAFAGYSVDDAGKIVRKAKAETLSEARQRAMRLRAPASPAPTARSPAPPPIWPTPRPHRLPQTPP
jgi:hypothetical protein